MSDPLPHHALQGYWDEARQGRPDTATDLDPDLTETVRWLQANDAVPPPNPARLARIREDLMRTQTAPVASDGTWPIVADGHVIAPPWHARVPALPKATPRRRWVSAQIATVLLLTVTVVAGYFAFRPTTDVADAPDDSLFPIYGFEVVLPDSPEVALLLVDRAAYRTRPVERGDVVLFDPPVPTEKPYVKRVIGLPGETVEIRADGYVYINGQELAEPYIINTITECATTTCGPQTIPADAIYVLGDDRPNSADSRIFGPVPIADVIGKVVGVANHIPWVP